MSREPVAIIGAGMVGTALAFLLNQQGHPITGIHSRSPESSQRLTNFLGTGTIYDAPADAARTADIVFITTPDDRIGAVCHEIAEADGFLEGAIILHCSGALPSSVLEIARKSKAHIGSMHPLQSFASLTEAVQSLKSITWAIEGDKRAIDTMDQLIERLGGHSEVISVENKILYHAGAVMASNYLVVIKELAEQLLSKSGLSEGIARRGLQTLMQGTLTNLDEVPPAEALTGPILRGDLKTLENHLEAINRHAPQILDVYKKLGQHTVAVALHRQALPDETARQLIQLFSD